MQTAAYPAYFQAYYCPPSHLPALKAYTDILPAYCSGSPAGNDPVRTGAEGQTSEADLQI